METKICKKCGKEKPINDFYKHKEMSDGHLNFCKECVKAREAKYRLSHIEHIREYDRNRPNAKERGQKQRIKVKQNSTKYKRYCELKNIWAKLNKFKRNAHSKVLRAIKSGILIRPTYCQICGKDNCKIEGHHYDYSKPLDIIWVCTECHGKLHRKYNKLEIQIA